MLVLAKIVNLISYKIYFIWIGWIKLIGTDYSSTSHYGLLCGGIENPMKPYYKIFILGR
jgi:hypothetical protein